MWCQKHVYVSNTLNRLHEWSGNGLSLKISGKSSSQEKKASGSLKKGLRDNKKYTPGRFFTRSIYFKRDEQIKRSYTNSAVKAEQNRS